MPSDKEDPIGNIGRDGSLSRPCAVPVRESSFPTGGLGEAALPGGGDAIPAVRPVRKSLPHSIPSWVPRDAIFFITINCAPRGRNQLAHAPIAARLIESIANRMQRLIWWPRLVLFMPDHLHALMNFASGQSMPKVVADWKRYTARHIAIEWQRDFFDHRIRDDASLAEKWEYILQNPVRAGLVPAADGWPYVWTDATLLQEPT